MIALMALIVLIVLISMMMSIEDAAPPAAKGAAMITL